MHGLSLDRRSHGGLGKLCDFTQLQQCMNRIMRGRPFGDFMRIFPSPGSAQCLHLHEVLSAASSFYAHLCAQGKTSGSEEELLLIYPQKDSIYAVNERWVLGRECRSTITLRHASPPKTTVTRLPRELDSRLQIVCDGHTVLNEDLKTRDFPEVYGQLNRMLSKLNRVEKAKYAVKGRMRFTNVTAFAGLMLLTLAHESMHVLSPRPHRHDAQRIAAGRRTRHLYRLHRDPEYLQTKLKTAGDHEESPAVLSCFIIKACNAVL